LDVGFVERGAVCDAVPLDLRLGPGEGRFDTNRFEVGFDFVRDFTLSQ
jgi:hypothetical protein